MVYVLFPLIAILPATFYMLFIIAFDSQKPEPFKALLYSALLGGIAALPVVLLGNPYHLGDIHIEEAHSIKESLMIGFLNLAIPAEFAKWILLCIFLSLNKFYDEYIDGIVYSVCLAMGYAGIWGVFLLSGYAEKDISTFLEISAITVLVLVPVHFIAGTLMGYFFALASKDKKFLNHALALFFPILINGSLCVIVAIIGNHWEYYFFLGIILAILAMVVYTQIFRLLDLDGVKTKR